MYLFGVAKSVSFLNPPLKSLTTSNVSVMTAVSSHGKTLGDEKHCDASEGGCVCLHSFFAAMMPSPPNYVKKNNQGKKSISLSSSDSTRLKPLEGKQRFC
ncbi:hypothetical protein TRVL_08891 [Trypanosoma vivax]|nr:hypothetical protein TRVL_08891 [Trypanosoma vivax]